MSITAASRRSARAEYFKEHVFHASDNAVPAFTEGGNSQLLLYFQLK